MEGRGRKGSGEREERDREGGRVRGREIDSDAQSEQDRRLAKAGPASKIDLNVTKYTARIQPVR